MSGIGKLQGTPWHVEKFTRAEGDERRHRSYCVNYDKNTKHCYITHGGCWGTSHCEHYCRYEKPESEEKKTSKNTSYSWKADNDSIRISKFMSDLKEFTTGIRGCALKELGYTGPDIPSSQNEIIQLFERLIENLNIPGVWPTNANLRYIVMSVLSKNGYSMTSSTYINPLDVVSILSDVVNSKTQDKRIELLLRECEMRIALCQQLLWENKEKMKCISQQKEEDYERLKNFCLSIRDIHRFISNFQQNK